VTSTGLNVFELTLSGGAGGGVNDATVTSSRVRLFQGSQQLVDGVDYTFSYDPATNKIRLTSKGQLFIPGGYRVVLDNAADGIRDSAGGPLQPNRDNGQTVFNLTLALRGPTANLTTPLDNGAGDPNPALNRVDFITSTGLPRIEIKLNPNGSPINNSSVSAADVQLFRDGVLLTSPAGYTFSYVAATQTISLVLAQPAVIPAEYRVELANGATGIFDQAGGRLQPNQADGKTAFYVSVLPPGPVARLVDPADGGTLPPVDKDPDPNDVLIYTSSPVTKLDVKLNPVGLAIADASVSAADVTVLFNGTRIDLGTDYLFEYLPDSDLIRLLPVGSSFQTGAYSIQLDNTLNGILDVAGNRLRPNRPNGTTVLNVSFAPAGEMSIPQGIFIANLGLSDVNGSTYVGFALDADPLTQVTVQIVSAVKPTGAIETLVNTTLTVDENGSLDFERILPDSIAGELITITITGEFGQTISVSDLVGPVATSRRAFVSRLFSKVLKRDGVLTATEDEFTPIEVNPTRGGMVDAFVLTPSFADSVAGILVQQILGRSATTSEIETFSAQFEATGSLDQARRTLLTSDEFAARFGLPPDLQLNFNNASHQAAVRAYVQAVYAILLPGVTLTPAQLDGEVFDVFEAGRGWIISNALDGGILGSIQYRTIRTNQAYLDCLARPATTQEIAQFSTLPERDLLRQILKSDEFFFKQVVESIYRDYLQRGPAEVNATELSAIVSQLVAGTKTELGVRADVIASAEFRANVPGALAGFVENAFCQILGRKATVAEVTSGVNFVNTNGGDTVTGRRAYAVLLLGQLGDLFAPPTLAEPDSVLRTDSLGSTGPQAPAIGGIAQSSTNEGQGISFVVQATSTVDVPIVYELVSAPTGATINRQTGLFQWTPSDNYDGLLALSVRAKQDGTQPLQSTRTFLIDVGNLRPTASLATPAVVTGGVPQGIVLSAGDPGVTDQNSNFRFEIDWDNNGIWDETVVGPSGSVVQHVFSTGGPAQVKMRATDKDGGVSDPVLRTVQVEGLFAVPDPETGLIDLVWSGGDGADEIILEQSGPTTVTVQTVRRNGIVVSQSRTFTNITGRVEVFTAGGNDKVTATNMTSISVFVDGGAGNDVIFGGRAADTILGGDGNDTISGSKGADLIRGGEGDDQIYGEYAASASLGSRRADMSSDTIYGEGGNDFIYGDSDGGEGQGDYIDAGDGDDTVIADGSTGHRSANDTVFGGAGNDLIFGDSIEASATNGGSDQLEGGSGNDIIYAGGGSDVVRGGTGSDLIIADRLGSLTLQAMQAIRQEWNSSRTLAQRRDNITGRNFTGLNGSNFIVPTVHFLNANVFDDQAVDGAFAGAGDGAGDWLIVTSGQDQSNEAGSEDLIDLVLNT
jgi:hypothetical protein